MAKLVPFRGLRYNLSRIDDPASVMAPPYDVISPALQEDLYRRSPFNVVRLILGKTEKEDSETANRYTRAAADFQQWQQEGILVQDPEPSIYLYDQEYPLEEGSTVVRRGFIALSRIEEFTSGVVKPHEKTLPGLKVDRFSLIKTCSAHFSPVFSLYADPCCVLEALSRKERERQPEIEVVDDDAVRHRLWRVTDSLIIRKAHDLLDSKPLFIADGHHRYEAAINFRNYQREKHPNFTGKETFNYVLMYFANMEDQGVLIFPTHRLIFNLPDFRPEPFLDALAEWFEIEARTIAPKDAEARKEVRRVLQEKGRARRTMALFAGGEMVYYLSLRDEKVVDCFFDPKTPKALRTLDVSILHQLIFEKVLGITAQEQEQQSHLKYVKNFDEPFEQVLAGQAQAAFLMNATRMSEVRDVANAGEKMPQKSTYFYPKLLTGLVFSKIVEGEKVTE
jgi:uncharacterized protein (DUF1015 family)